MVFAKDVVRATRVENRITGSAFSLVEAAPMSRVNHFQQLFERNLRAEFSYDGHEWQISTPGEIFATHDHRTKIRRANSFQTIIGSD